MKTKPFVLLGLLLAGIFWVGESVIHDLVFHQGQFSQNLFNDNPHEVWMRSFIFTLFTGFGFIAQSLDKKRVEAEARRGDEQFKQLVDSSPEAIGVHRDGKLVYVNAAAAKILGSNEPDEFIGKPVLSFVHPDGREAAAKRVHQIVEKEMASYRVEEKLLRLNGEPFVAEIAAIPVEFEGDNAVMFLGRDIDERKRWEHELQASAEQAKAAQKREHEHARMLEQFFQHTHDCIVLLDKDFNFIRVNQAYADACKRDIEEFPGHNHFEFYPSPLIEDFKKVVATGIQFKVYSRPFEFPDHPELGVTYWDLTLVPIHDANGEIELLLFTLMDVTDRQRAELELSETNRAMRTISACNTTLIHATDEDTLLKEMCRVIVDIGGYGMACVGHVEHDAQKSVRLVASAGHNTDLLESTRFYWSDDEKGIGPVGDAIRTGKTVITHDFRKDKHPFISLDQELSCGFCSCIALPLHENGDVFGILKIYADEAGVFNDEEVRLLEEFAEDFSYGITSLRSSVARKQAEEKIVAYVQLLEESMQGTLQAVSNMVEQRDPYTAGHERRVGIIAADIAREMGWTEEKCHELQLIGLVHDLGKIAIPAEILSKPGRLTPLEYDMVKSHVERGYEILKDVKFPLPIADIIRQHHERMDGSGYPQKLKGQEILIEARILAVADVVESMAAHRPYRAALGIEAALKEITDHRDTSFDASVVDALLKLVREKGYQLPS